MPPQILTNMSLKNYNSWKVGGEAQYFCQPQNEQELYEALLWAENQKQNITVLGDGSNVLISDKGIGGLVICLKDFKGVESELIENNRLQILAKAGTSKMDLMRIFLKHKLSPALFLSGLPGNLAGGIVMNAGVREDRSPKEFHEIVDWIEVIFVEPKIHQIQKKILSNKEIQWSYRKSSGWQPGVIVRAQLSWPMNPIQEIPKLVIEANKQRISKQPLDLPSCGSTFKNPEGTSAGKLIDECGLKGFTIGGAQVSSKHANFIVNMDKATAMDIKAVIEHVKKTVFEKTKIQLMEEVKYLGSFNH